MNKSMIMKRAWEIKKQDSRNIFALCLKMAWSEAKAPKKEKFDGFLILDTDIAWWDGKYTFKEWSNYGKHRIYVTDSRKGAMGYIDLDNNATPTNTYNRYADEAIDLFLSRYDVA